MDILLYVALGAGWFAVACFVALAFGRMARWSDGQPEVEEWHGRKG